MEVWSENHKQIHIQPQHRVSHPACRNCPEATGYHSTSAAVHLPDVELEFLSGWIKADMLICPLSLASSPSRFLFNPSIPPQI
jgi:hypothetical protein